MKITETKIKVKDVFNGFTDDGEDGVFAYGGNLTIRPPYQREFVYDDKKQEAVLQTILKGFPLNTMYWCKTGENTYEVLDGQQRTLSVMHFLSHKLQVKVGDTPFYCDAIPDDLYEKLMNYEFMVYICEGSESEKLEWFKIVNIGGEVLTPQELRNSVYTGKWLSDAKRHFSKSNCAAKGLSDRYIKGSPIRQELLEKALLGICEYQGFKGDDKIEQYMALHVADDDADELWQYFQDVIHWVEKIFPDYYKDMCGLDWCHLYNTYGKNSYNSTQMKEAVKNLHMDDEVQKSSGIYEYLLLKDENLPMAISKLNLRLFSETEKQRAYNKQNGICPMCGQHYEYEDMRGDHKVPWSKGGKTTEDNLQMLCKDCNLNKLDKY